MNRDEWLVMTRKYLEVLWNFLFPPYCLACQKESSSFLCPECVEDMHEKISIRTAILPGYSQVYSLSAYAEPFKHLIWLIKFRHKSVLIPFIQELLAKYFPAELKSIAAIVPVPIHRHRRLERGFNQAEEFIRKAAESLKIPLVTDCLVRERSTRSLYAQDKKERAQTIAGKIQCAKPELIKGKDILVFDDILTTGATLTECGKILQESGAASIWGLTLCKA